VTEKQTDQQTRRKAEEHIRGEANDKLSTNKWTTSTRLWESMQRRLTGQQEPPLKPPTPLPQAANNTTSRAARRKLSLILIITCVVIVLAVVSLFFVTTPRPAGTIVGEPIAVGPEPYDVEGGEGFVWTTNLSSDTISRINPRDATSQEIRVGGKPIELGVDQGAVWVWNYTDAITRVDVRTGEVTTITGGSADAPISGIAVGGGYVWLSHEKNGTVTRINMQNRALEGDPIAVGSKPIAMAFGNKFLYVVNSGDNTISTLDGSTGQALGIPLKIDRQLGGINVYDDVIYVGTTDSVTQIDERSFVIGEPIPLKGGSFFNVAGDSIWVTYPLDNVFSRIDLQSRQRHGEPIKGIGKDVGDFAFADNMLWVSNPKQNTVTRIRPSP
jgi:DNA-binding beta-propeller fold protein YncE